MTGEKADALVGLAVEAVRNDVPVTVHDVLLRNLVEIIRYDDPNDVRLSGVLGPHPRWLNEEIVRRTKANDIAGVQRPSPH